jgi:hypothetical protein
MTTYLKDDFVFDADLVLEDSLDSAGDVSAIVASQAGKVLDVAKIIDLGDGLVEGYMIVDIDAIVNTDADELYEIFLQGAQSATFATAGLVRNLAALELGSGELLTNATATTGDQGAAGDRYVVPFRNELNGEVFRYARVYQQIANGTGGSITDTIWLSIKRK